MYQATERCCLGVTNIDVCTPPQPMPMNPKRKSNIKGARLQVFPEQNIKHISAH